jgi:hypothetical protein
MKYSLVGGNAPVGSEAFVPTSPISQEQLNLSLFTRFLESAHRDRDRMCVRPFKSKCIYVIASPVFLWCVS